MKLHKAIVVSIVTCQ